MKISLLGTGLLGTAIGERLLAQGCALCVYNRTHSKTKVLKDKKAVVFEDVASAIAFGDLILCVLSDIHAIKALLFSDETIMLKNKAVIQMGTIAPQESIELHTEITKRKGEYLECPVLGSRPEAREGNLILFVGADKKRFDDHQSFLKTLGPNPRYVGEVGKAAALKLALNQLIVNHAIGFSVTLGLVEKNGLDVNEFMDVLKESSLYAPMFDKKLSKWLGHDYENPNFPVKHLLKDLGLILSAAEERNMNTKHLSAMKSILEETIEAGFGEKDYSAVYEVINGNQLNGD